MRGFISLQAALARRSLSLIDHALLVVYSMGHGLRHHRYHQADRAALRIGVAIALCFESLCICMVASLCWLVASIISILRQRIGGWRWASWATLMGKAGALIVHRWISFCCLDCRAKQARVRAYTPIGLSGRRRTAPAPQGAVPAPHRGGYRGGRAQGAVQ